MQYGSCCRTSDKWHPVLLLGDAGCGAAVLFLPACRKSTFGYGARQAELGFVSCLLRSTLFLAYFFFFCYPKAGSEAAFSCQWGWARLQQGQDTAVVRAGPCAGGAELPLESCWWPGQWDKRCAAFICLWSIPSLANSSVAACHLGGIEMFLKWPFWFPFLLPALFLWKLLHSGCCQFKSLLNHSKRVCRISVLSVTYTVLPGPFLSVTEK